MGPDVPDALRRFDLTGRVAVVTGASSGLGEGLARALASVGARVAVVARRHDRLVKLAEETGGVAVGCDLLDPAQLANVIPDVAEKLGRPEILVNAAGNIFTHEPAEREPLEAINQTLGLNLVAPFRLSQDVFPHMVAAGRGAIVFVSSISGRVGVPGIPQASYAASKLGLSGLAAELAVQWARHGIRVNTVAPGFFRSEITAGMYDDERTRAWLRRNTPLPADGAVDDFAGAVLWLVSDAGRYVTGQTVVVDGGWTARLPGDRSPADRPGLAERQRRCRAGGQVDCDEESLRHRNPRALQSLVRHHDREAAAALHVRGEGPARRASRECRRGGGP